jgi:hypothetical protein
MVPIRIFKESIAHSSQVKTQIAKVDVPDTEYETESDLGTKSDVS